MNNHINLLLGIFILIVLMKESNIQPMANWPFLHVSLIILVPASLILFIEIIKKYVSEQNEK